MNSRRPTHRRPALGPILACLFCAMATMTTTALAQSTRPASTVLFDMEAIAHKPGEITDKDKRKVPAGTVEAVEGKVGKAARFAFPEGASGGFMTARIKPTPDLDRADGFSFWVKGDGSDAWGGIELIDADDFGLRYGYCFPIDSDEWRKITVPWRDLTPELAGPLVDPKPKPGGGGYAPSGFGNFWFGKWFYWRDYPAHAYAIDQVVLEPKIEPDAPPPAPPVPGLSRVRAKLKAGRPVTIVTMGDSLSDKRHWANHAILWSELLAKDLKAKHGGEVTLINPAVGGTTLNQNLVTMPKWSKAAPSPDLVVIWFGGNDWANNVRGPRFAEYLRLAVDRVRRQTKGSADVLLLTTAPGHGAWETYRELEQAARDVAKEKSVALGDAAAAFRKVASPDEALKREYWAWDKVHLGAKGHAVARDVVLGAIEGDE